MSFPFVRLLRLVAYGLIICTSAASASVASTAQYPARDSAGHALPLVARILDNVDPETIVVKFAEGTGIRLENGTLGASAGPRNDAPHAGRAARTEDLSPEQIAGDLATLSDRIATVPGATVERRVDIPEATLASIRERAEARSGLRLADMNLYFEIHLPTLPDAELARARLADWLAALNSLAIVQVAFADPHMEVATLGRGPESASDAREPFAANERTTTPDFTSQQGYLYDSPVGVFADTAWSFPSGRGEGIRIIDIEFGWRFTHEDLRAPFFVDGGPGVDDHGTAVLGEFSGDENTYGVTGIAPAVEIGGASVNGMSLAQAVILATTVLEPGEIYVIELHAIGPFGNWLPMEFWQDNFDAIQTAAAYGLIGCEAAGNGSENLDFAGYEGAFDRRLRDSGAIMCGAGTPQGLDGEWFTNYGNRVDLQGWGSSVVTTGYGDLWDTGPDSMYTAGFNGTSSATPIVTGSVASLQGQTLALFSEPLTAWLAAEILSRSGSPWAGGRQIGERPNLLAARDILAQGFATTTVTVRDAETLLPLEGMVVEIVETGRLGISGPDGRIVMQMSAGDFTLHTDGTFFYSPADLPVTVVAGQNQDLYLDISLRPTGVIAGRVLDENLHAVPSARIVCLGTPLDTVLTAPDGLYSIAGIPEDTGYLMTAGGIPALGCAFSELNVAGGETTRWSPVLVTAEDFELDNGGFTGQGDWAWGRPIGLGPGGAYSGEKCWATNLTGYYHTYQWINLTSPAYDFSNAEQLQLSFHHWYWIEEYKDGGQVQVKQADGTWVAVTPVGGYDSQTIPTLGPAFTGASGGWQDEIVDLTPYAHATLQVRFRFASDNTGVGPGWYIDDVAFDDGRGAEQRVDLGPDSERARLMLQAPSPNPALARAALAFHLSAAGHIRLVVCDAEGRSVRTLLDDRCEAGDHTIAWDGRDANGACVPAGIYYVKLTSGEESESRPLVLIR